MAVILNMQISQLVKFEQNNPPEIDGLERMFWRSDEHEFFQTVERLNQSVKSPVAVILNMQTSQLR